jgi:uncharacterized protein
LTDHLERAKDPRMTEATYTPGRFVWHELFSNNIERTKSFYSSIFGWTFDAIPMGPITYHMAKKDSQPVGGLMPLESLGRAGLPPFWLGYVSVPSVDEAAKAAAANGGLVAMPPNDVPNIGRFSILGDPGHGYSAAWRSFTGDPTPPERPVLGTFCWDQINAPDPEQIATYYQKVYGWAREPFPGSNEMWVYTANGQQVASLMKSPQPMATWMTYLLVETLESARKQVVDGGGKILLEKQSIPNIGSISVVMDNVGAVIGLFQSA